MVQSVALSSRERLAAALMARMYAPRTPLVSSSDSPAHPHHVNTHLEHWIQHKQDC